MAQTVFNRYEKKYVLTPEQYGRLTDALRGHMEIDEYGKHTIYNLYYDTVNYGLVRRSIEKPVYKEKLRIRSYGAPREDSEVFVEIKKKYKGVVNKRRVAMTLRQAYNYVERNIRPVLEHPTETDAQNLKELDYFLQRYRLRRGMYLAYDRIALKGVHDDFRLTFDTRIRNRIARMDLEEGGESGSLLPEGYRLMETKVMGATPLWFSHILADCEIYPTSFSKYGNFYKQMIDARPRADVARQSVKENARRTVAVAGA